MNKNFYKNLIIVLLMIVTIPAGAAGIRDEIFYLDRDNKLQLVTSHFAQLKPTAVPELVEILKVSLANKPLKTISGKYPVSAIAQGELILKLAEFADPRAKNIVIAYLKRSTDRFNREVAAVSLGSFGDPAVIPLLRESLRDRDPVLQLYAARSLGELKDTSGYETALKYLHSEDKTLKIQSMYALAMIGKTEAVPLLQEIKKDTAYRDAATLAEKKISYDHLAAVEKSRFLDEIIKTNTGEVAYWAASEYVKLGAEYLASLRKMAEDKSYKGRESVADILKEKDLAVPAKK